MLRDLGIKGKRVVKGFTILLTESMREKIHGIARAYQVVSTQDGVVRCSHCTGAKGQRTDELNEMHI